MPQLNQINASIIVAIIAISPLILNFIYTATPFITTPIIGLDVKVNDTSQIVTIKNNGNAKATNMTAFIISDQPISKLKIILNTIPIKSISFNNTKIKIEIPKFNQGVGALIKLEIWGNPPSNSPFNFFKEFNGYSAYFVYDQGSNDYNRYETFWYGLTLVFEAIAGIIIIGLVRARWTTGKIITILLNVRSEIIQDIENNINTEIKLDARLQKYYKNLAYRNFSMLHEYTEINDFAVLINKRNKAIQEKNFTQKENHLCLREIDRILNNTDWSKHANFGMIIRSKLFRVK